MLEQLTSFNQMVHSGKDGQPINWIEGLLDATRSLGNFHDVVRRVAMEVILPAWKESSSLWLPDEMDTLDAIALERLVAGRDLRQLIKLNKLMHTPASVPPAELRPYLAEITWPALFTEEIDLGDGYSIRALSSQEELVAEGFELDHCVGQGGYTALCASGQTQVVSLMKEGAKLATIQFDVALEDQGEFSSHTQKYWRSVQFKGHGNAEPSAEARKAHVRFVEKAQSGAILFNPEAESVRGNAEGFEARLSITEKLTGIPEDEPELVELIHAHYRELGKKLGEPIFLEPGIDPQSGANG
jgi:hypothetical protein